MLFQTEFEFTLPKGYADRAGVLHREGVMRLATAADELTALGSPKVKENPDYLIVPLLARVVTRLGALPAVTEEVVEGLFLDDLGCLRELYSRVNREGEPYYDCTCPSCGGAVRVPVNFREGAR